MLSVSFIFFCFTSPIVSASSAVKVLFLLVITHQDRQRGIIGCPISPLIDHLRRDPICIIKTPQHLASRSSGEIVDRKLEDGLEPFQKIINGVF